jgi:hypothetical protein
MTVLTSKPVIMKENSKGARCLLWFAILSRASGSSNWACSIGGYNMSWTCKRFISLGLTGLLGLAFSILANAALVVAPNSFASVEGGTFFSFVPAERLQQVFAASQFSGIPAGGALITQIALRPDAANVQTTVLVSPLVTITFSTTSAVPEALSPTFANNVGANPTLVFSGPVNLTTANAGPVGGPRNFDVVFNLTTPFLYDPAAGNLLLDLTNSLTGTSGTASLDASLVNGDGVSRVLGTTVNPVGGVNVIGYVVQFTTAPRITAVAEPGTLFLLGMGLLGLIGMAPRQGRSPMQ